MNEIFAHLANLTNLVDEFNRGNLTQQVFVLGFRGEIVALVRLIRHMDDLTHNLFSSEVLNHGFWEAVNLEGDVEYCPLCNQSQSKGHAENCIWGTLEEFCQE